MPSQTKCSPRTSPAISRSTTRPTSRPTSERPSGPDSRSTTSPGAPAPEASPQPSGGLPASAFSEPFLAKLRLALQLLEETTVCAAPAASAEALLAGPLAVEEVRASQAAPPAWAVVRRSEPVAQGGRAAALYRYRSEALLAAAVLPAVPRTCPYHLADHPKRLGYPLHVHRSHIGHLSRMGAGRAAAEHRDVLLSHLHLARYLVANPEALALLLEAVGPEALPVLGRALARRIEALLE